MWSPFEAVGGSPAASMLSDVIAPSNFAKASSVAEARQVFKV